MNKSIPRKTIPHGLLLSFLALLTIVVYAKVFGHDFLSIWDDPNYVTQNEAIKGFTKSNLKTVFTSFYVGNYAPVQMLSYMLDYELWGLKASGFLLTNVMIHISNGILIYFLLFRLNGQKLWSFLAAFIFLFHPVQVESVAWVSQRKNLLAMFFFMLAFHFYLNYRKNDTSKGKIHFALSLIAYTCSLLSKSVAVILPLVLYVYDYSYIYQVKQKKWLLLEKTIYMIPAFLVGLVALLSQSHEAGGGMVDYFNGSFSAFFFTMTPVFLQYLLLLLWPSKLSALYTQHLRLSVDFTVVGASIVLISIIVFSFYLYKYKRHLFFWYITFFIGLLPVSQIIPIATLINDRYLYFPLIGISGLFGGILYFSCEKPDLIYKYSAYIVITTMIVILPILTFQRISVWKDAITLFSDVTKKYPDNGYAWKYLGVAYRENGQLELAKNAFETALTQEDTSADTYYGLACIHSLQGNTDATFAFLEKAIKEGYSDLDHIKTDPDLNLVRSTARFRQLTVNYFLLNSLNRTVPE